MPEAPFQLRVDGFPDRLFRVQSFTGKETLSEGWAFEVVATAEDGEDVERAALASRAELTFHTGPEPRAFYGVVASVRLLEVHHADHRLKYELRLVPRLWLLKRKRRTRIFQKMRVTDVVAAVLGEAGIAVRFQLTRAYPEREYLTQYEETDLRFVQRLLAESGIYFYFFGGGPVGDGVLTANAVEGAAAAVGGAVVGQLAGADVGALVGSAVNLAEALIPGDSIVCADDASCYPPVAGDDPAALAASTAVALAPAVADALGAGDGLAGAAVGAASAIAGSAIAAATDGGREAPVLRFLQNEEAKVTTYDKITRLTLRNTVRSSAAAFRDYDPLRPAVRLQSKAVSTQPFPPSPFEAAAMAIAAAENVASTVEALVPLPSAVDGVIDTVEDVVDEVEQVADQVGAAFGQKVPLEVYEHHSNFLFPKWAFADDEAPRILRQKRRRASIARGESGCSDFSPGHRFALHDHPAPQLDGAYVLISVEHRGETHPGGGGEHAWRVYRNELECAPAEMTYPPRRPRRKSVQVNLTATVVGPPGEEIHVDALGQIKVQFHWDREGKLDGRSSCWIRVMQPWAGAAWGHQFIPRVGMEVVVGFEGGDPDKPMVLGSLYNGTHPPPFKLPEDKTRSGIRTQSSRGGGGFNELSFEDRRGAEQIRIIAQRDLDETVAHDEHINVGRHRTIGVGGNQTATVNGSSVEVVGGARSSRVTGTDQETLMGDATVVAKAQMTLMVNGEYGITVGTADKDADATLDVHGNYVVGASRSVRLNATGSLRLTCGSSVIEITPDEIKLEAKALTLVGAQSVSMEGKGPALHLTDEAVLSSKTITLKGSRAFLKLDKEAQVKGELVKLNCDDVDEGEEEEEKKPEPKSFQVKLHDDYHKPYANKKYRLLVDGKELNGVTDADGLVEQDVSPEAASGDLTLWLGEEGQEPKIQWHLTLSDLPPIDTPHGVRRRLRNLGYYRVAQGQSGNAEAEAIRAFQKDHGMEPTGVLDDETRDKIKQISGE